MTSLPEPTFIKYFYKVIKSCDDCPHSQILKAVRTGDMWVACFHPRVGGKFVRMIPFGDVRINYIPRWCPLPGRKKEII